MKFSEQFEFHKIPEWYNMYLDFEDLLDKVNEFAEKVKEGESAKLPGYYQFTMQKRVVPFEIVGRSSSNESSNFQVKASDNAVSTLN